MTRGENHLAQDHPHQVNAQAFRWPLARLREPLTSLYARAYLLKRHIRQGKIDQESLGDLDAITQDAQVIETRMQELEEMVDTLGPFQKEDQRE